MNFFAFFDFFSSIFIAICCTYNSFLSRLLYYLFNNYGFAKVENFSVKCWGMKKNRIFAASKQRGVAQLVARYVRDVEAASSSLVTPTFF